jgi:MFS transporter, PHS family, inorganic phosphate transporter
MSIDKCNSLHDDTIASTNSSISSELTISTCNLSKTQQSFDSIQLIAMISNFSTAYNVVNISLVLPILKEVILMRISNINTITSQETSIVASSLLFGMMIGQIIGGALGDIPQLGRLNALRIVMIIQIVASVASSLCIRISSSSTSAENIFIQLALWRLLLGIGAGGVYPLAAVLSVEQNIRQTSQKKGTTSADDEEIARRIGINCQSASKNTHKNLDNGLIEAKSHHGDNNDDNDNTDSVHRVVLTFSAQGAGFLAVPILSLCLLYLFPENLNLVWRLLLCFGALPGIIMLFVASTRHRYSDTNATNLHPNSSGQTLLPISEQYHLQNNTNNTKPIFRLFSFPQLTAYEDSSGEIQSEYTYFRETDRLMVSNLSPSNYNFRTVTMTWWESIRHEENLISKLIGSAGVWFLFDVLFYGNTLFQPIVIQAIFGSRIHHDMNPTSVLQSMIAVPGYIVSSCVISSAKTLETNRKGKKYDIARSPKYVMLQGFLIMSILYLIIGTMWNVLVSSRQSSYILIVMYGLTFFFSNYGPNTSTFILPSLIYSKKCRSSLNGISAACGKLGAFIGAMFFDIIVQRYGNEAAMIMCSGISFA